MIANDPVWCGVPESTPPVLSIMPVGRAPVSLQLNGAIPPLASVNVNAEYAVPFVPTLGAVVLSTGAAGLLTVNEYAWVAATLAASCTLTVNVYGLKVALAFGVPEITPLWLRVNPVGSAPTETDHVRGAVPPLTGTVKVKAEPLTPAAGAGVVAIVGTGAMWIVIVATFVASDTEVADITAVAAAPDAGAV